MADKTLEDYLLEAADALDRKGSPALAGFTQEAVEFLRKAGFSEEAIAEALNLKKR
ncbi:MAG: hypothetical protein K2Q01_11760 [Rickettsiales bacterium]|nr:hypothetical protein [Rickettsiales bacterium]